ncbi:beta-1,6-N-acetylglucosaminyltransferase [Lichenibacterium minor]|uniref:beta-1,6-N-acetylglucosaminyltransferase n=1 Tax=Lichenibacterium minor TaxID=2316528 RepID=UPI0013ECF1C7|nr:beta-1,6-N-acetylglucosaminyltransferase [Lichenibacterium minor]
MSTLDAPARGAVRRLAPTARVDEARVAYVVLAHSDPALFGRLMRRLDDPRAAAFVHVDGKAPLEPFRRAVQHLDRVHFVEPRIRVMWAGFSQVESTLASLEAAIAGTSPECSHIVVVSGADYPLAGNDEILDFFADNAGRQFIRRLAVMESGDPRQLWRLRGRHFREWADPFTPQPNPLFALEKILRLFPRQVPRGTTFALGSNWVVITRDCAIHCVERAKRNRTLVDFVRPASRPDEIFLHVLVQNSPFGAETDSIELSVDVTCIGGPSHYGNVHALTPNVPVRSAEEADAILSTRRHKLFTQRCSSNASAAALNRFDAVACS